MNLVILLDHVLVSGSRFLLSVVVARLLGLENFGVYSLLWTIVTLASAIQIPISIIPMMQLGPRILATRENSFYTTSLIIQLFYSAVSVPFVTGACLVIVWERPDAAWVVLAVNLYVIAFNQYEFFRRYFFTRGQQRTTLILDAILYGILLVLIFWFLQLGTMRIADYFLLSAFPATALFLLAMCRYPIVVSHRLIHLAQARKTWKIAAPLLVSTLAGFVSGHAFVYATAIFLGTVDVGGIAAARNMVGPLIVLMMALENSMTREIVLLYKKSPDLARAYARKVRMKWLTAFAFYVVLISIFAKPIVELAYGKEFAIYYRLIYWFGAASLLQVVSRVQTIQLRTEGKYSTVKAANLAAMWMSLTVSVPLVYWFGLTGAMLTMIAQQGTILLFQIVPLKLDPHFGILPWGLRRVGGA